MEEVLRIVVEYAELFNNIMETGIRHDDPEDVCTDCITTQKVISSIFSRDLPIVNEQHSTILLTDGIEISRDESLSIYLTGSKVDNVRNLILEMFHKYRFCACTIVNVPAIEFIHYFTILERDEKTLYLVQSYFDLYTARVDIIDNEEFMDLLTDTYDNLDVDAGRELFHITEEYKRIGTSTELILQFRTLHIPEHDDLKHWLLTRENRITRTHRKEYNLLLSSI